MRKFATLDCLVDLNDTGLVTSDAVQHLRQSLLGPYFLKPKILDALQKVNFRFHRTCSFHDIIRECNAAEGQTLLMFWGCSESDSKATMSVISRSSSQILSPTSLSSYREQDHRSRGQQTDISCRSPIPIPSPPIVHDAEERAGRGRLDPLTFSSPSSLLSPTAPGRSMSILGSVCALLLNKQSATHNSKVSPASTPPTSDNICRICFGGESAERLVRPCSCRGTIAAVHRSCLERWLLQAATSYCELCRHHYIVTRSHKWSWTRSLAEWAVSGRGRALAADAWRAVALGAASVLGTARALHACDRVLQLGARRGGGAALAANLFSSLIIGIIGALNGLLTTWMLLKIQEHQLSWQAWRDSTLHVRVVLAEDGPSPVPSDVTIVADGAARAIAPSSPTADTRDRSTNIADPFMVLPPNFDGIAVFPD